MGNKKYWHLLSIFVFFTALLCSNNPCAAENILVAVFVSTKSHKMTYMPLIEELGKRGHNITILSPIEPTKKMKNIKEILTIDASKLPQSFVPDPFKMKEQKVIQQPFANIEWFADVCRQTYELPHVLALMEEKFDLIFAQPMVNECALGFFHRINAPLVLFSPVAAPNFLAERFGTYFPPSFNPSVFQDMPREMNFYQRFVNLAHDLYLRGFIKYYFQPAMQAIYHEKLGTDIPSIDDIYKNASLILSNGHFSLHGHKPLLPDIVEVGGLHCRAPKPLPKNLEDFISKGKDGFIYFSMGSAIKGNTMPEDKRKMFVNVFAKLKQQVIWKWETETMPDLPANVLLHRFLPQQDLLGHKDIKMFITHCGGGSTEEAIYHAVPLIGLPMFSDQPQNAKLARDHGVIIELDWNELTEDTLLGAINEILNNPIYKKNVNKLSAIYKDQPESPMARAVYWVEYVLRHKGATHLRSVGRNLNVLQYHSVDVILAYLTIFLIFVIIVCKLLACLLHAIYSRCLKTNKKSKRE